VKKILWLFLAGGAAVTGLMIYIFSVGPHMKVQPNIRSFDAAMPLPPPDSVPMERTKEPAPSAAEAAGLTNAVANTPENCRHGRVYYEYYCLACHGTDADGAGPVGRSYVPAPADLRTAVPAIRTDGELMRRMLTGVGHEPALSNIVRPEHRWYLVRYLRGLTPDDPNDRATRPEVVANHQRSQPEIHPE